LAGFQVTLIGRFWVTPEAPVQIEGLERGPWSELRGQVPANIVSGKTEDAPDASKNMHLHLRSASLRSRDDRSDQV
jgi:hypothetical protein